MKLWFVFLALITVVVLFHIPTWMILIHQLDGKHDRLAGSSSAGGSSASSAAAVPANPAPLDDAVGGDDWAAGLSTAFNFYHRDNAKRAALPQLNTRHPGQAFDAAATTALLTVEGGTVESAAERRRVEAPIQVVEIVPLDVSQRRRAPLNRSDCTTVVVMFCLECIGPQRGDISGGHLPWHILTNAQSWFKSSESQLEAEVVEVFIVTGLQKLFSVADADDTALMQQLVQIGIDPHTLQYIPSERGGRSIVRFRFFSLQQLGIPSARPDLARYGWDVVGHLGRVAASAAHAPERLIYVGPHVLPSSNFLGGGFFSSLLDAEEQAPLVSCVVLQAAADPSALYQSADDGAALLHDGFDVFSGDDDVPTLYARLQDMPMLDPRVEHLRPPSILVPSPLCFAAAWNVFAVAWPNTNSSGIEPRATPDADAEAQLFTVEQQPFIAFVMLALAMNATAVTSNATSILVGGDAPDEHSLEQEGEQQILPPHRRLTCDAIPWSANCSSIFTARLLQSRSKPQFSKNMFVVWDTFCLPCFGFSNEVMHFVRPLEDRVRIHTPMNAEQCFCPGTPTFFRDSLYRVASGKPFQSDWKACLEDRSSKSSKRKGTEDPVFVYVSHKDPGSFASSMPNPRPDIVIGRAMYEFNVLPSHWLAHQAEVDEIWVPSRYVRWVFEKNGFAPEKLVVVPEPLDVFFFDPATTRPLNIPYLTGQVPWRRATSAEIVLRPGHSSSKYALQQSQAAKHFKFLSVFKWEPRKGAEILLRAYFSSFTSSDPVSLYLVSYIYGENGRDAYKILEKVRDVYEEMFPPGGGAARRWPNDAPYVEVVSEQLPESTLASLYRSVDCFVLPTRGEGWGLPIVQALSMGLVTIATNFSGNVDFLTADNSYLLPVESVEMVPHGSPYGFMAGKGWPVPDQRKLSELMVHVTTLTLDARNRVGQKARRDTIAQYSEEIVAEIVMARLAVLEKNLMAKRAAQDTLKMHKQIQLLVDGSDHVL